MPTDEFMGGADFPRCSEGIDLSFEEFSQLYDDFYDRAVALFNKYNPCHISKMGFTCTRLRRRENRSKNLCCSGCKYVSDTGCTVKALGCKLGMCYCNQDRKEDEMENRLFSPEFLEEYRALVKEAEKFFWLFPRENKEEMFESVQASKKYFPELCGLPK